MAFAALGFWLSGFAAVGAVAMAGAVAALALGTGVFPRWLG